MAGIAGSASAQVPGGGGYRFACGLFGPLDLIIPGRPDADGWRKVTQFINVPETAKDMHVTLANEYRDFAMYDISAYDGWRQTERNYAIRKALRNWQFATFRSWDDVEYQENVTLFEPFVAME